jgi:hypothetical protein
MIFEYLAIKTRGWKAFDGFDLNDNNHRVF